MRALALTLALLAAAAPAQKAPAPETPNPPSNDSIVFWNMSPNYVNSVLDRVPQTNALRLALLRRVFTDLQCSAAQIREQPAPTGSNLLCTLPAQRPVAAATTHGDANPGTILFIAHYEHDGPGQSAIEDWSGAVMIPFLFHALSATPRHHTFLFAEVNGTAGAKALFSSLTPEQRHNIKGIVSFDALGLGPTEFYISPIDNEKYDAWNWLYLELLQSTQAERVPAPGVASPGNWLKSDATREFRHHGIPSILIHSVPRKLGQLPASANDNISAIDRNVYANTLTLLCYYAVLLDQPPPSLVNKVPSTPTGGHRRH